MGKGTQLQNLFITQISVQSFGSNSNHSTSGEEGLVFRSNPFIDLILNLVQQELAGLTGVNYYKLEASSQSQFALSESKVSRKELLLRILLST
jgi:hypothetical protein